MEQHTDQATTTEGHAAVRTLPSLTAEIDISKLELGDILLLDDVTSGREYLLVEVVRLLDRVLVGGVAGRPINQYRALLGRMLAVVQELANPKAEG